MLAPLDNETIFKKAFTDKEVFECFVGDIFGIDIQVENIETEKRFDPIIGHIDFKIDIYAETTDHRFIIEIQRIDYDYNFDRFLHYFLMVLADQQKTSAMYTPSQQVLGVVVLTRPYKVKKETGEAIKESVMVIDFNPRNLLNEQIKIWEHSLVFLNPNPKYNQAGVPKEYGDWLDLLYSSLQSSPVSYKLNLNNKGVAKVVSLIDYDKLDPVTLSEMKKVESMKVTERLLKDEAKQEGIEEGKKEVAMTAIKKGLPNEIICELTGLSEKQVSELRNLVNK